MELIQTYMERDFPVPSNFEEYAYVSQLVQAYGIRKAIEAQRRSMLRCMGTLYWQLNDCWPVISWSSLDYYNRWKALHYAAKEAYKDVLISFEENENDISVFVISDKLNDLPVKLHTKLLGFNGKAIREMNKENILKASSSQVYQKVSLKDISKKDQFLVTTIYSGDSVIAENLFYFVSPKNILLPEVNIKKEITEIPNGYRIKLMSDNLVKNLFLQINAEGHFSDNYFDLLPNQAKTTVFNTDTQVSDISNKIDILYLNQIE